MKKYLLILALACAAIASILFLKKTTHRKTEHNGAFLKESINNSMIVENALKLELPPTVSKPSSNANAFSDQAMDSVRAGEYGQAIAITFSGLKEYPKDFGLQSDLAALLGDYSEITPSPLKEKMVKRSKEIFEKLLKEVNDELPRDTYFSFKNEYYFWNAEYKNQYELGVEEVNFYWGTDEWLTKGFKGYYSQGVGAARYAQELIIKGNRKLALKYAEKALVAWAQYFTYRNDYYNSYVHYALALGILGYEDEMMKALQRSASFINRDLSYHEFKEVLDFVEEYKNSL